MKARENISLIIMAIDKAELDIAEIKNHFSGIQNMNAFLFYFTPDLEYSLWEEKKNILINKISENEFKTIDNFFKQVKILSKCQLDIKNNLSRMSIIQDEMRIEIAVKEMYKILSENQTLEQNKVEKIRRDTFDFFGILQLEAYIPNYLTTIVKEQLNTVLKISSLEVYNKLKKID